MALAADLSEYRLMRALRAGQPGAFPSLWSAHVGAIWSVVRALAQTDAEALGWVTTFRVDLGGRVATFDPEAPLGAQVGQALHAHLRAHFTAAQPLPTAPLPRTEAGLRQLPVALRLPYLVELFFDVPSPGPEPRFEGQDDTDARLYTHAALLRTPPLGALFLPPGNEAPTPKPRWGWFVAGLCLVLIVATSAWVRDFFFPTSWAQMAALHTSTFGARELLLESSPPLLSPRLTATDLPARLSDVPDLSAAGLALIGGRVVHGPEAALVLVYHSGSAFWTLQHHQRAMPDGGDIVLRRGGLEARAVGDTVLVGWTEGDALWILSAAAPPTAVVDVVEKVREIRANNAQIAPPLFEAAPTAPALK